MVTPFLEDGIVDIKSAKKLIKFFLENDTIPFILGTTGECTSIPLNQREVLVKILIENKYVNVPLITGVNGLTFADTITEANKYLNWGIDAVVITLPAYFKLTDEQIYGYFKDLSEHINGDIILYNIPKTVNMSIPIDVVDRLSYEENIIGIKDSELNEARLIESLKMWSTRNDFFHVVGVNKLIIKGLELGSKGIIPSSANIQPQLYNKLYKCCMNGEHRTAYEAYIETEKLSRTYQKDKTLGTSLAALKCILSMTDLCKPYVIKPLTNLNESECDEIKVLYNKTMNYV